MQIKKTDVFAKWFDHLKDRRAKIIINQRIMRGTDLIILLCGGEKSTQQEDIKKAKNLAKEI